MPSQNSIFEIKLSKEEDIVYARQLVRELSLLGGLSIQSQTRFITAVSEIAHNALVYAGGGIIRFSLVSEDQVNYKLQATVEDNGPGIADIDQIKKDSSANSKEKGIAAAKNLVHHFQIESDNKGTKVTLEKNLPPNTILSLEDTVNVWSQRLNSLTVNSVIEELQEQNHHLVQALYNVEKSQEILNNQQALLGKNTEQLERANRLKTNFVANMSHEMRTPLNAVIGISEILSKTSLNKHQQFLVNSLDVAGRSLLSLINDILDLSKLEAGKFEIEDIDFNLVNTIKEALSVVQPQAMEKYVDLLLFVGPYLPTRVHGDPHRLQQVIINIAANAIKFSNQNSEADIFVYNNQSVENGTQVRFIIFDAGIGVSDSDQDKLFEEFSQLDSSTNRKYGGSGLGLSICRHLINLMNGEIGLFSIKDVGTAFWFDIPFICKEALSPNFRKDLENLEVIFTDQNLLGFELLLRALNVSYRRLNDSKQLEDLKANSTKKLIFIADLPIEFALLKPSRLFNRLMEHAQLPYRIENFRSGKEKFLLGKQPFQKTLPNCGDALLVEDHQMNQFIGRLQLEELGFNVDVCGTGPEAIQSVIKKKYNIIFMDCQIPEMDGYDITKQIRILENQTSDHTPIIALTASALSDEREKCLAAGMDDYLTKPVEPELLYNTCKKWLQNGDSLHINDKKNSDNANQISSFIKVIDWQKLRKNFSQVQYTMLINMFQADSTRLLAELDNYFEEQNIEAAAAAAHTLHGASRLIFAKDLAEHCKIMESALRSHNWKQAKESKEQVKILSQIVENELKHFS